MVNRFRFSWIKNFRVISFAWKINSDDLSLYFKFIFGITLFSIKEIIKNDYKLDDLIDLGTRLWYSGKIHQPRNFLDSTNYRHPFHTGSKLWFQVVPTIENTTPAVVDAYEKYKMLDTLTK